VERGGVGMNVFILNIYLACQKYGCDILFVSHLVVNFVS
jgi:hypothetical protein